MPQWVIYSIISLNSDSYSENLKTLEYEDGFKSQELNSPMHMKYSCSVLADPFNLLADKISYWCKCLLS